MANGEIDSFFSFADRAFEMLGVPPLEEARDARANPVASRVRATARAATRPASPSATSGSTAVAIVSREFHLVDAIDAATGAPSWVVTNGRDRAECSSRDFAERVRTSLG